MTPTSADTLLPLGIFPCADGYVAMMMTTQQLDEMLTVLGSDELTAAFARPDAFVRPETKEILDGVSLSVAARTDPRRGHRRRAGGGVAGHAGQRARRAARGGPSPPARLLGARRRRSNWARSCFPVRRTGSPRVAGRCGGPRRVSASASAPRAPATSKSPAPPVGARDPDVPPLRGIRVLDLTTVWSGPYLTALLGDLGAEVIRVETPHVFPPTTKGYVPRPTTDLALGALARLYGPLAPGREDRPYNRHAMNNSLARGKRSCTLDVRYPEQRELFMQLVAKSDVFVENLKSTTLHQMGIHETELLDVNPRLIVLRLPPAGLSGDWAHYTGFGGQFDGLTGLAALLGHRGTTLMETPSTQHMDSVTGPAGAFATLAALHYRAATGRGQVIELSQSENVLTELGDVFVNLQLGVEPQRFGNRDPHRAPQGVYLCADGRWLALTVTDDDAWHGLTSVLGRADLAKDERLADVAGRHAAHDELDDAISVWTTTVTADAAFHALQQQGSRRHRSPTTPRWPRIPRSPPGNGSARSSASTSAPTTTSDTCSAASPWHGNEARPRSARTTNTCSKRSSASMTTHTTASSPSTSPPRTTSTATATPTEMSWTVVQEVGRPRIRVAMMFFWICEVPPITLCARL